MSAANCACTNTAAEMPLLFVLASPPISYCHLNPHLNPHHRRHLSPRRLSSSSSSSRLSHPLSSSFSFSSSPAFYSLPCPPPRAPRPAPTMGIKGLTKLLGDNAASCSKVVQDPQSLFGRKLAIDASMCIYQLLVAVRIGSDGSNMTNEDGTNTSQLLGIFYRSIRLLELGIKPIFVFDGAPPTMKAGELQKRADAKKAAEQAAQKAKDEGDLEMAAKFSRRINRITPEMLVACKKLLTLTGIPVVNAPCEAEAQCAELVKKGKAYATASEDMDSLTFGTNVLIRQLWQGTAASASKKGVKPTEFRLDVALAELQLSMDEFIDLCILCGCDYVDPIKGVGVVKALQLIRKYKTLDKVVSALKTETKYQVPEDFPVEDIRKMFIDPDVTDAEEVVLKWTPPKTEELKKFLVEENQFDPVKVENGIKRLVQARKGATQVRVDSFFTKKPAAPVTKKSKKENDTKPGAKKPIAGKKRTSSSPAPTPTKKPKKVK